MAMVMITCPVTRRQVFTGVEVDPASVALLPAINTDLHCPDCGNRHTWSMLEAELACDPATGPGPASPELERGLRRLRVAIRKRAGGRPLRRSMRRAS